MSAEQQLPVNTPTVAVIIPARNGAAYIDRALASLVTQTVPPNEVVVVDDGSDDDTYHRARRWADLLPLKVIRSDPKGTWHARRTAIEATDSEFILQLDADDTLLPGAVAGMTQAYARQPGLVAPRRFLLVEGETENIPRPVVERLPDSEDQYVYMLVRNYIGVGCLYSRKDYEAVGGYRPCRYAEDWDLWLRFAAAGIPISLPAEATYVYNMHSKNISTNIDIGATDLEILRRFLDAGTETHRRTAKLAFLQRAGIDYVEELDKATVAEASVDLAALGLVENEHLQVRRDTDLGHVLVGSSTAGDGQRLVVVSPDGSQTRLRSLVAAGGILEANETDQPSLRWEGCDLTWFGWH
ncbi:glycosyltransferase family 2 protein [Streptomyces sp. NBC_01317]|uniref:glycosyltransferase n=1 Tax=Streptomyces sp. NBC_01317 TaxID=2903822 RepID=UPI002E1553F7|nr:glycosyltransferase family 2 protein [Streptomyces sp. NBC_01317]